MIESNPKLETPQLGERGNEGIHLVIIGAGLAGLAAALSTKLANPTHKVTILETVKELQEIGAGLQITPNGTRLLHAWRLSPVLAPLAAVPSSLSVHRYDGTRLLAHEPNFQTQCLSRYAHPFWDVHRVDLQREMVAKCISLGVELRLGARAVDVHFASATVKLQSGELIQGDVVLLTDGLWSAIRPKFLGKPSPAILTGDLAYRITLRADELTGPDADELRNWIRNPTVNFWLGPKAHCVGYSVSGGEVYNLVFLCPDDLPLEVVKLEGSLDEMKQKFAGWDPLLLKFLAQVKGVHKWKLMWLDALPEWANKEGTFFMAGDCCHPMLPYLAQGANSSLEDGAIFGSLLGKVSKAGMKEQLPCVSRIYQKLRMERGRMIQLESFKQRDDSHMEDGPEQEKRDALMTKQLGKDELEAPFPSRWTCPAIQPILYGYDAYAEAEKAYRESPF
ncbi:hypothetical protein QBC38DRAFT_36886 [Podospora fimiseda]|uniref:FAD-binding domain-containing protein n=1 Tax=Podospora fimiseda TaxID=252190 RepID=A0AAN7GW17_9PEZI|nr:hypothetical protein QBC38DRAFT_36886 [Podospora fimiseda]